jgi:hypothetical protein
MQWIAMLMALVLRMCTGTADPAPQGDAAVSMLLDTAELANKEQRYESTILSLKRVVDDSDLYAHLPTRTKYRLDRAYGWAAFRLIMPADAHRAFARATAYQGASAENWFLRFQAAKMDHDLADAFTGVESAGATLARLRIER